MLTAFVIGAVSAALAACETMTPEQKALCAAPDNVNAVRGHDICFGITTYAHTKNPSPTLVIYLHGDVSSGGPAAYMHQFAYRPHGGDVITIVMLRPGYSDGRGKKSTGSDCSRRDCYTAENIDAIADAVGKLRQHHHATKVVLVGHSGGAATGGVLIGRRPGVVDAVILVSCPCEIVDWRNYRGSSWPASLDPLSYADRVPLKTEVVALTGSYDQVTPPEFVQSYIRILKDRGVRARFELISEAGHGFRALGTSPAFKAALERLSKP